MPSFDDKEKEMDWLAENCEELICEAKTQIKYADAFGTPIQHTPTYGFVNSEANKGVSGVSDEADHFGVKAIINTTNLFDSHKDVHLPGLWNKSLKTYTRMKHLQEHSMRFKDVIADKKDLSASVQEYEWKELGYQIEGKTQALQFDSNIRKSRNSYMFEQYKDGHVDNHSVGMQYVKVLFAMNSDKDQHAQYKINWDKYIDQVANKGDAEKSGYMWLVLEAKAIEGSAVVAGSNFVTPTLNSAKHSDNESETVEEATEKEMTAEESLSLRNFINNL